MAEQVIYLFWGISGVLFLGFWGVLCWIFLRPMIDEVCGDEDRCPKCNDPKLIRFSSLDKSVCSYCGVDIPWRLKPGQPPIVSSSRDKRRYRKGKDHVR